MSSYLRSRDSTCCSCSGPSPFTLPRRSISPWFPCGCLYSCCGRFCTLPLRHCVDLCARYSTKTTFERHTESCCGCFFRWIFLLVLCLLFPIAIPFALVGWVLFQCPISCCCRAPLVYTTRQELQFGHCCRSCSCCRLVPDRNDDDDSDRSVDESGFEGKSILRRANWLLLAPPSSQLPRDPLSSRSLNPTSSILSVASVDSSLLPEFCSRSRNLHSPVDRARALAQRILRSQIHALRRGRGYTSRRSSVANLESIPQRLLLPKMSMERRRSGFVSPSSSSADQHTGSGGTPLPLAAQMEPSVVAEFEWLDVLCIQGVYDQDACDTLISYLCGDASCCGPFVNDEEVEDAVFPFCIHSAQVDGCSSNLMGWGSGLMIFSRYPVEASRFVPFQTSVGCDRCFCMGVLCVKLSLGLDQPEVGTSDAVESTSEGRTSDGVRSDCFQNTAFIFSTHFHDGDRVSAEHSNAESVSSLRGSLDSVHLTSSAEIRLEQMRICQTSCMQFKLDTHDRERGERIVASLLVGNLGFDNASGADSNEQRSNFFCDSLQDEFLGEVETSSWKKDRIIFSSPTSVNAINSSEIRSIQFDQEEVSKFQSISRASVPVPSSHVEQVSPVASRVGSRESNGFLENSFSPSTFVPPLEPDLENDFGSDRSVSPVIIVSDPSTKFSASSSLRNEFFDPYDEDQDWSRPLCTFWDPCRWRPGKDYDWVVGTLIDSSALWDAHFSEPSECASQLRLSEFARNRYLLGAYTSTGKFLPWKRRSTYILLDASVHDLLSSSTRPPPTPRLSVSRQRDTPTRSFLPETRVNVGYASKKFQDGEDVKKSQGSLRRTLENLESEEEQGVQHKLLHDPSSVQKPSLSYGTNSSLRFRVDYPQETVCEVEFVCCSARLSNHLGMQAFIGIRDPSFL